jgi:hypothetical protein
MGVVNRNNAFQAGFGFGNEDDLFVIIKIVFVEDKGAHAFGSVGLGSRWRDGALRKQGGDCVASAPVYPELCLISNSMNGGHKMNRRVMPVTEFALPPEHD